MGYRSSETPLQFYWFINQKILKTGAVSNCHSGTSSSRTVDVYLDVQSSQNLTMGPYSLHPCRLVLHNHSCSVHKSVRNRGTYNCWTNQETDHPNRSGLFFSCHLRQNMGECEGVSKSFRTGRLERELQMVQLCATRSSCIAIL
jgi:hypothetical protein